ncbi:MAG: hypothetical protein QW701_01990 [Candidatus Nezhaarchaeales archaeon]
MKGSNKSGKIMSNRRGQIIILAVIVMMALMLSLTHTIVQISVTRQEVVYEPIDEVVLAITSDFERCLTRALAKVTEVYYEHRNTSLAEKAGIQLIQYWLSSVLELYEGLNICAVLSGKNDCRSVDWIVDWVERDGKSYVYTTFSLDIGAYGLSGLALTIQKSLDLRILDVKINSTQEGYADITVIFEVKRNKNGFVEPLYDLTINDVLVSINGSIVDSGKITGFKYSGQGVYTLTVRYHSLTTWNISITVTASDGVKVAAFYSDNLNTSKPLQSWRTLYVSPGRGRDDFVLTLIPSDKEKEISPINPSWRLREGNSTDVTPYIPLGSAVKVLLYARSSSANVELNVTLGFYDENKVFHLIGSTATTIRKSPNYLVYELSLAPSTTAIPRGATLTLILKRNDKDQGGGTIHILCGPEKTRIMLW